MIEASDVRKHFGAVQALGGVSFTARDGHITALLGPNGAGKTTLLHRPRHLLLDEPSRGLDVMSTRALRNALTVLRKEGCCVLMATHVMQEVTHLCDDVIVIAKGHTVAQGSPEELCRRTGIANLEDAFVSLVGEEGIAA